ncbi:UNVERIFIED_CONTAM: hypothetical protein IGO34_30265, partial [Salmonella enterica subsp. enterica serovar Weltevreden]
EAVKPVQTVPAVPKEEGSSGFMWFCIIAGGLLFYYLIKRSVKSPEAPPTKSTISEQQKEQLKKDLMKSIKITVTTSTDDKSITDVTGKS